MKKSVIFVKDVDGNEVELNPEEAFEGIALNDIMDHFSDGDEYVHYTTMDEGIEEAINQKYDYSKLAECFWHMDFDLFKLFETIGRSGRERVKSDFLKYLDI